VIDNVDDILAAHVNNLRAWASASALIALNSNTETLAADLVLTDADAPLQFLDAGGTARAIELPAEDGTNHLFVIVNTGGESLTVNNDAAAEIVVVATAKAGIIFGDGTQWIGFVLG
jgi:hypothetical protein